MDELVEIPHCMHCCIDKTKEHCGKECNKFDTYVKVLNKKIDVLENTIIRLNNTLDLLATGCGLELSVESD